MNFVVTNLPFVRFQSIALSVAFSSGSPTSPSSSWTREWHVARTLTLSPWALSMGRTCDELPSPSLFCFTISKRDKWYLKVFHNFFIIHSISSKSNQVLKGNKNIHRKSIFFTQSGNSLDNEAVARQRSGLVEATNFNWNKNRLKINENML